MHKYKILTALAVAALLVTLAACGGGSSSGASIGNNITMFKTSYATAQSPVARLEEDVITGNVCPDTPFGTIQTNNQNFTITTKALLTPSLPIVVTGYTVSFFPKNAGTPAIEAITSSYNTTILPGSVASIPVSVITNLRKNELIAAHPEIRCASDINYQYDVNVTFHAYEGTDNASSQSINASFVLSLADYI